MKEASKNRYICYYRKVYVSVFLKEVKELRKLLLRIMSIFNFKICFIWFCLCTIGTIQVHAYASEPQWFHATLIELRVEIEGKGESLRGLIKSLWCEVCENNYGSVTWSYVIGH